MIPLSTSAYFPIVCFSELECIPVPVASLPCKLALSGLSGLPVCVVTEPEVGDDVDFSQKFTCKESLNNGVVAVLSGQHISDSFEETSVGCAMLSSRRRDGATRLQAGGRHHLFGFEYS
ncbi:hypothetical protein WR25_20865 [Diploscapter pachys]|uniref:Uncharacterized protein n=1 Tax=Diploscapter pachys TaxID=2018661 RepID=A0A2A2JPP1_9BILA|nr:hypothetical protein WR25_20865 [Diploscapter pachys]